jgi:hypothetical protein
MTHSIPNVPDLPLNRRSFRQRTVNFSRCLLLGMICSSLMPIAAPAAEKEKGPLISRAIAKEMMAAQKALQASQWAEALKNLDAAEAKPGINKFDQKTIYDFKGFANIKLGNLKAAQTNYEQALATGEYSPEDAAKTTRTLFRLSAGAQQYQKAVEFGKQVAESGAANADDLAIMAQSYYLLKDCKNSAVWADKAISASRKAGDTPKENLFLFKLQCAFDANDTPATVLALEDLIRLNGKTEYWNKLLRFQRQDEKEDRNLLMIYRLMYVTNAMNAGADFMEMAQLLGDAALPGEAQAVLEKGISSGIIKDDQKDRTNRLLNSTKSRADADRKNLAQLDAEATKNPAGELDVKLGEVYYGFGDYDKAVTAINRGLQKNQIKHLDEAYVYLGLAQAALKNNADAKKALVELKKVPNMSPRVLKLWELYAEKLG